MGLFDRLTGESLKEQFRDEKNYSPEFADSLATKYLDDMKARRSDEEDWPWIPAGRMPMYSESKMFMNVYTMALAKSLSQSQCGDHQIFVVGFCPGATKTDMLAIGMEAMPGFPPPAYPIKNAAQGADTGVWLALLPQDELAGKVGKLFGERTEYPFDWANPPF